MSKGRYYGSGVEKALFMLSRGTCYEPTCKEQVLKMTSSGTPRVNVQIAHIRALGESEARYEDDYPRAQLNMFANLILLCAAHHSEVDSELWKTHYPKEVLLTWKTNREGDLEVTLKELPPLTDNTFLQELMVNAINNMKLEIIGAIDDLKDINLETAKMIKSLVSASFNRPYMSDEAIGKLEYSARVLASFEDKAWMLHESAQGLGSLEDAVGILYESSLAFKNAPEYIPMLYESSLVFKHVREYAPVLYEASLKLRHLEDHVFPLTRASQALAGLEDKAGTLSRAADAISRSRLDDLDLNVDRLLQASSAIQTMSQTARSMERASENLASAAGDTDDWSWYAFRWGMFWSALTIMIGLGVWAFVLIKQGA